MLSPIAPFSNLPTSGFRRLARSLQVVQPMLLALVLCFAASGCRHSGPNEKEGQKGSLRADSGPSAISSGDMFDLKNHPNATILHPVQISILTDSERKFGIAPKRGSEVEYQPDIILMEQGDKAIRSIASNGLEWEFDANAELVDAMIITWRGMADSEAQPKCGS